MSKPVYLPIDSVEYFGSDGQERVVETKPSRFRFQVERLIIQEADRWLIRSLIVGGVELMGADDAMPATAFVGDSPLFVDVECPKNGTVKLTVRTAYGGVEQRLLGVCSGPRLED